MLRPIRPLAALVLLIGARVTAQPAGPPIELAAVEVTGTRLARPLAESPAAATVLTRDDLERSGRTSLAEAIRELPEFPGNPITDTVAINTTRGVIAADLRGLGAGNTLVLVNGRRTTVNASAFDTTTFVDLNRFPPGLLERVEILKGGASAIYGADAVGGVINLITRRQPVGGEIRMSYGNTFETDAAELNATIATGATRGRLGISVGANVMERHAQAHRDRDFTRTANLAPRFAAAYDYYAKLPASILANYDGRSLTAPNARFILVPGQVNGQNGVNLPDVPTGAAIAALPGTGGTTIGTLAEATPSFTAPFRSATGGQFNAAGAAAFVAPEVTRGSPTARNLFDFNSYIWTVPAAERASANMRLDYETAAGPAFFAEAGGGRNRSRTEFMPAGVTATVPRTNPYNPFGVDVTAVWRIAETGPRRSLVEDENYSALAGWRSRTGSALAWETAASYSRDTFVDTTGNALSAKRTLAALASANPATALNPFGGENFRDDPALVESLKAESWFGGAADLLTFDAQAAHDLVTTTAGPVRAVLYAEHRRERFGANSDPASQAGDMLGQGQTGADANWARNVFAAAAEARAPLIAGPAGERNRTRLSLEAAARLEDFSGSFHSGIRPTIGLVARLVPELLVRASHAWTFRAPTLPQLYAPQSDGYYNSVPDPRRPVALTGDQNDGPNVSRLVREGGNPGLSPEKGRVVQAGAVWEPRAAPGLSLEVTWFRYDLENIINGVGPVYVLDNELGGLGALVHRAAGTQTYGASEKH